MSIQAVEWQDEKGDIIYPHTDSRLVKYGNENVEEVLRSTGYPTVEAVGKDTYIGSNIRIKSLTRGSTKFTLFVDTDSTGTNNCTLDLNKFGVVAIKDANGNPVKKLKANIPYNLCYNGTDFIQQGKGGGGNANPSHVLIGKTFTNDNGEQEGTMAERGNVTASLDAGQSYTIPEGHHGGSGKITANSLESQTQGTASNADILSGKTAIVNGNKVTGDMPDLRGKNVYCGAEGIKSLNVYDGNPNFAQLKITPSPNQKPHGNCDYTTTFETHISNLLPQYIRSGITVGDRMTGTFTNDANAQPGHILSGQSAYVNGNKINGNIPIVNPSFGDQYHTPNLSIGAHSGDGQIRTYFFIPRNSYMNNITWVDYPTPYLQSQFIVSGANILGVPGSATVESLGGKRFASGVWTRNAFSVTVPLSFTPTYAYIIGGSDTYQYVAGTYGANMTGGFGKDIYWYMRYNIRGLEPSGSMVYGDTKGMSFGITANPTYTMSSTSYIGIQIESNAIKIYSNYNSTYTWVAVHI